MNKSIVRARSFLAPCALALILSGCESAHIGMGIPVPGPIKPSVGLSVDKSGVKGTGGVGGTVGKIPVCAGGSTKPLVGGSKQ